MGRFHVGMVGIGYAGLPLAVQLAKAGNDVVGFDIDRTRVETVNDGRSPVDTVTDAEIRSLQGRLSASTDPAVLADSSVIVVCAPTPVNGDEPDLHPLTSAVETVAGQLRPGQLVIVESTTHPGTTDGLLQPILEKSGLRAGADFHLAYSPERIDPGNARYGIGNTPRVVGGLTAACAERAAEFYRQVTEVHVTRGMREAEAAKILENTYRQINIALVNEFSQLCHGMGIDVWDTVAAASTKPYGFQTFWPGAGVGGHCIPADPLYLIHHAGTLGMAFHMAETAHRVNEGMPLWVADRITKDIEQRGISVSEATVLLLGVTYKANTDDTRHTPAVPIARALTERGATVLCHDPYVDGLSWADGRIDGVPDLADALDRADLSVLLQRHDQFDLELIGRRARRLFDTTGSVRTDHSVLL
ncbi:nucleotide sugar dehydrogenase [Streptomyces chattanoogensis]|uniref:nucleotide sugar dehydrogenase n=1 Tax=Streptomyces chattanoogensis TaxID=66876 RepID=UPI00062CB6A4